MGSKSSKMTVKDAKLSTAFGSFGCGSCSSTCCDDVKEQEQEEPKDPKLIYIEKMIRYELKTLEHLLLSKMVSHYEKGVIPSLSFKDDNETSIKLELENFKNIDEVKFPKSIQKMIDEQKESQK